MPLNTLITLIPLMGTGTHANAPLWNDREMRPWTVRRPPKPNQSVSIAFEGKGVGATSSLSRSEEHTSELQSLMRISYAVFCLKKKKDKHNRQMYTDNLCEIYMLINRHQ